MHCSMEQSQNSSRWFLQRMMHMWAGWLHCLPERGKLVYNEFQKREMRSETGQKR